jgi:bisanhydrobacterioruberin hydratase
MIYIIIPLILMFMDEEKVIKAYWYYPYINGYIRNDILLLCNNSKDMIIMKKEKFVMPIIMPLIALFTLLIAFSGYMTGSGYELRGQEIVGVIFTVLIALPGFLSLRNFSKALKLILSLSLFAYIIESTGVLTGFPYGAFSYGDLMGLKLFGIVPLILPFAYVPIVLGSYFIAEKLTSNKGMIITITTFLLVLFDLVLDPGAVALGYWNWIVNGFYYGIPLSNYLGWILSSVIAGIICYKYNDIIRNANPKLILISPFLMMVFWTFVTIALGMIIPSIIGIMLVIFYLGGFLLSEKAQNYHHTTII